MKFQPKKVDSETTFVPNPLPPGRYTGLVELAKIRNGRILMHIRAWLDDKGLPLKKRYDYFFAGYPTSGTPEQMGYLNLFCSYAGITKEFDTEVEEEVKGALEGAIVEFTTEFHEYNGKTSVRTKWWHTPTTAHAEKIAEMFPEEDEGQDEVPF
jgi:hypothetical protein